MASTEIRERRRTLRYRNLLVRQAVQMKNKIAVLLMEAGVSYNKQKLHKVGYSPSPLGCMQATRGNSPLCAAAACCGSLPFPSADPRFDSSSVPSAAPAGGGSAGFAVGPESGSMPCGIPAGSRSAGSLRSCRHQSDRSSSWPRRWRAASADAPPSLAARADVDDRRSSR